MAKLTTEQFIINAQQIHGDKYDYSNTIYDGTHHKLEVICLTHGSFFPTANSHVSKKSGCPQCAGKHYMTLDLFIARAKEIHGEFYDYSRTKYQDVNTPLLIVCSVHGEFTQTPRGHILQKHGCPSCGSQKVKQLGVQKRLTKEQFLQKAIQKHGETYDYSHVDYISGQQKVVILCKEHGPFFQTPENHNNLGQGCPMCGRERSVGMGGYTEGWFNFHPEKCNDPALFYVISIKHNDESFIKIGITIHDIKTRYDRGECKEMEITTITSKYMGLKDAFLLEQRILEELKQYQYWPTKRFGGYTECLKNKPEVVEKILILTG